MNTYTAMAFDYGLKNIGVAVGQSLIKNASELPPISARDGIPNWTDLNSLFDEWLPKYVLVGLPLNMDDSDSEMCRRARKFGHRIHGRFGLEVNFIDERLSTHEAKQIARDRGHKGHYASDPIDSIAAAVLLRSWWETES